MEKRSEKLKCIQLIDNEIASYGHVADFGFGSGATLLSIALSSMAFILAGISVFLQLGNTLSGSNLEFGGVSIPAFCLPAGVVVILAICLIKSSLEARKAGPSIRIGQEYHVKLSKLFDLKKKLLMGTERPVFREIVKKIKEIDECKV